MSRVSLLILCVFTISASAQITVRFVPTMGNSPLQLISGVYNCTNAKLVTITMLKLYITNIQLLSNNTVVWSEPLSYHLLNADSPESFALTLNAPAALQYNTLRFNVGVDSTTTVAGVMGGDLDPTKGMYWTWQSGYINFKLEGSIPALPTRNHEFQFHIGGYAAPFNTLQTVTLPCAQKRDVFIGMNLQHFLDGVEINETHNIMSPNVKAVHASRLLPAIFTVQTP